MLQSLDALIGFVSIVLALSLLITTLVQMVQNWLNWRGETLAWSLTKMFAQMPIAEEALRCTEEEARQVVETLLRLPGVAVDSKRLAKVIDPNLLPLLLEDVAGRLELTQGEAGQALAKKVRAMRGRMVAEQKAGVESSGLLAALEPARDGRATDPASEERGTALMQKLGEKLHGEVDEAVRFIRQRKDRAAARFEHFMTAARERFQRSTQALALALAISVCVVFRVDALQILTDLHADPAAAAVYAEEQVGRTSGERQQFLEFDAMAELNLGLWPQVEEAWAAAGHEPLTGFESPLETQPDGTVTRSDWLRAIALQEGRAGISGGALRAIFEPIYDAKLRDSQAQLRERLAGLRDELAAAPVPVLHPRTAADWWDLSGLLNWMLTGFLVALGAPFWFNILRQLTNLRPVLANALDPAKKPAGSKDGAAGGTGSGTGS